MLRYSENTLSEEKLKSLRRVISSNHIPFHRKMPCLKCKNFLLHILTLFYRYMPIFQSEFIAKILYFSLKVCPHSLIKQLPSEITINQFLDEEKLCLFRTCLYKYTIQVFLSDWIPQILEAHNDFESN